MECLQLKHVLISKGYKICNFKYTEGGNKYNIFEGNSWNTEELFNINSFRYFANHIKVVLFLNYYFHH